MNKSSIRLSTLAEIKVLSLQSIINFSNNPAASQISDTQTSLGVTESINALKALLSDNQITLNRPIGASISAFKTVGIARQIRIDEDYQTQNIYGIGSPTRPRIVPGNFSVTVACDRIQLDRRGLYDFMSSPEYFYSSFTQRQTGILDGIYYTYMFVKSKEDSAGRAYDIYALMPRSSSLTVTNGDVMVSNSVNLTGFKVSYQAPLSSLLFNESEDDITDFASFTGSFVDSPIAIGDEATPI
jgi:hypothetical protein